MAESIATHFLKRLFLSLILIGSVCGITAQTLLEASLGTPANAGILSESCPGPYSLLFERGESNTDTIIILSISDVGEAQNNLDYSFPAGTFPLEMLPEDTTIVIPITVTNDFLPEGFESLGWDIAFRSGDDSGAISIASGIIDEYEVEILTASDTIQWCRYAPLELNASSAADIQWSPTFSFDPPTGAQVTVHPFLSGWHYAMVGSSTCGAKDSVYFDLAIAQIGESDTVFICAGGDGVILEGSIEGLATTFEWIPSDTTLSDPEILTPEATPTITTTYILQSDIGICIASDTVVVRVDSLPADQHIDIAPLKPYYCAGEIVALFSPAYDSLDFPDITFNWTPDNGTFKSDRSLLNAALELQDTTLYVRENINNACITQDSILINVVPPSVPLSVTDTILCPGEMFQVVILSDQVTDPEWTPSDGLSCTMCLNPIVTVMGTPGSTIFYEFSGMILDCPVGAGLPIQIPAPQPILISGDSLVCEGDIVPLTITNPAGLSDFNWSVRLGNASLSCTNCPDPVVTIEDDGPVEILVTANTTNPGFCGAAGLFQFMSGGVLQVQGPSFLACQGESVLVHTGNPDLTQVQWSVDSGDLDISCTTCDTVLVTVNGVAGRLRFTAESSDPDICRVTGTVAVSVYQGDVSEITIMPDPNTPPGVGQGSEVTSFLGVNPTPSSVMWTVNGETLSSTDVMVMFIAGEQENIVVAKFINSLGCEQIDTLLFLTVPPSFMVPNAFTPNGDDVNDNFNIIILGDITVEEFMIFNRWGQKVFDVTEGSTEGWNGNFKNEPAASDTYVYTATLRYPDGRREIAKGDVILLR